MKALIFAAGRGERLKPLTNHTPKPLAIVNGKPLIQYHLEALIDAGVTDFVINVSWLHQQIIDFVKQFISKQIYDGVNIEFSIEKPIPLETGGGMLKAKMLLGEQPFIVVNADIYTDFNFKDLDTQLDNKLVHLVLVDNPEQNPLGDFGTKNGELILKGKTKDTYTYAGIGFYSPKILPTSSNEAIFSIVPFIKKAINNGLASAQLHKGEWHDVGTLKRLNELNQQ